jgi:GNAT superfamily N-acetyltransferase
MAVVGKPKEPEPWCGEPVARPGAVTARGNAGVVPCQWIKMGGTGPTRRRSARRLREQTLRPRTPRHSGLVAYLDGEPAGWCAVEPRTAYVRLRYARVPWKGRDEDRDDDGVWGGHCFVTRTGFRRRGVSRALAAAAVDFARERGARAVEGYPLVLPAGGAVDVGRAVRGHARVFAAAGFTEVTRPTPRRAVCGSTSAETRRASRYCLIDACAAEAVDATRPLVRPPLPARPSAGRSRSAGS